MPITKITLKLYRFRCDGCKDPKNYDIPVRKFDPFIKGDMKIEFSKIGWDFSNSPKAFCPVCVKARKSAGKKGGTMDAVLVKEEAGLQEKAQKV